jgi:DNA polymerase-3 subunit delta'
MQVLSPIEAALTGYRLAQAAGRLAHAWLVCGPARGFGSATADVMIRLLFCRAEPKPCGVCPACRQIAAGRHADVLWVEPESKSRQIRIEQIREDILPRMSQTTYEGGWRVCVLVCAERMTEAAQNAILKTLEEPPPKSMLILLTDDSSQLLPTILSRCQRIRLSGAETRLTREDRERVLEQLAVPSGGGAADRLAVVARFRELLDELKEGVQARINEEEALRAEAGRESEGDVLEARVDAAVREVREHMLRLFMDWQRDVLALTLGADSSVLNLPDQETAIRAESLALDPAAALQRVDAVEQLARRLDRNLPVDLAMEGFFLEKDRAKAMRPGGSV